eukprot:TRINITY_DN10039_c0_g1_i1.p1 TRINITY_DN10039_c0_g1~~TRINITY_DN10039_c0_g1_i1.p1  ORF type:complete len:645 (+),score=174.95 TRINITY_DN10039_c0_g1_i1:71-2005(+)
MASRHRGGAGKGGTKGGKEGQAFVLVAGKQTSDKTTAAAVPQVGDSKSFAIIGCKDTTVGPTIRGLYSFSATGLNHGKPVYKKDEKAKDGNDVIVFYWDERDGAHMEGWWIAPEIGGAEVWAFRPGNVPTAPTDGWKVPINGEVDKTIILRPFNRPPPLAEKPKEQDSAAAAPGAAAGVATSMLDTEDVDEPPAEKKFSEAELRSMCCHWYLNGTCWYRGKFCNSGFHMHPKQLQEQLTAEREAKAKLAGKTGGMSQVPWKAASQGGGAAQTGAPAAPAAQICQSFLQGCCALGSACMFLHSQPAAATPPVAPGQLPGPPPGPPPPLSAAAQPQLIPPQPHMIPQVQQLSPMEAQMLKTQQDLEALKKQAQVLQEQQAQMLRERQEAELRLQQEQLRRQQEELKKQAEDLWRQQLHTPQVSVNPADLERLVEERARKLLSDSLDELAAAPAAAAVPSVLQSAFDGSPKSAGSAAAAGAPVCELWLIGRCGLGDLCHQRHSVDAPAATPPAARAPVASPVKPPAVKAKAKAPPPVGKAPPMAPATPSAPSQPAMSAPAGRSTTPMTPPPAATSKHTSLEAYEAMLLGEEAPGAASTGGAGSPQTADAEVDLEAAGENAPWRRRQRKRKLEADKLGSTAIDPYSTT